MRINIRADDSVEIEGYVNAVERLSKPLNSRLGKFLERICKGAFKRALARNNDVRILLNHDWERDLGGTRDGNLELTEDAIGLHARAIITDKEVVEQARAGDLVGWSFGFQDRDVEETQERGLTVRNVKDLDLAEVSLINRLKVPAYDGTLVNVRTADDTESLNVSDLMECEPKVTVEERAEEPPKEEPREEVKPVDYTSYKNMIAEMKGD
jgi:HK97 family phage prohead protease